MLLQQAAHVGFVEAMDDDAMIQTCKEVRSFIMEKGPLPRTPDGHETRNREEYLEDHRHAKVIWEWFSNNLPRGSLAGTNVKVTLITHAMVLGEPSSLVTILAPTGHKVFVNKLDALERTLDKVGFVEGHSGPGSKVKCALNVAADAREVLTLFNEHFSLTGRARMSLGTALRVLAVRERLGDELCKELEYISDGADAFRHLTESDSRFTIDRLRSVLLKAAGSSAPRPPRLFSLNPPGVFASRVAFDELSGWWGSDYTSFFDGDMNDDQQFDLFCAASDDGTGRAGQMKILRTEAEEGAMMVAEEQARPTGQRGDTCHDGSDPDCLSEGVPAEPTCPLPRPCKGLLLRASVPA